MAKKTMEEMLTELQAYQDEELENEDMVCIGVVAENQKIDIDDSDYRKPTKVPESQLLWFGTYSDDEEVDLSQIKLEHIYNITVDEYGTRIWDDGSVGVSNHPVTYKCKVLKIEKTPSLEIQNKSKWILSIENADHRMFDENKKTKLV